MNTRIQELTDIIYNEGVVKGQEEADRILAEANEKARTILAEARKNANEILTNAGKESAANAENVRKELKLYASQAISALKSEITTVISDKVISDSVKGFTANQNDFNAFILSLAAEWAKRENIVISTADAEKLRKYFLAKSKALLDSGVEIRQVNGQEAAFSISPADGSYKVNFGEQEFEEWFKSMLRPQLVEILF